MSRIGKIPVTIPSGVEVKIKDREVVVNGPKGDLRYSFSDKIKVSEKDGQILVTRRSDSKTHRELHGLTRALIANMVTGVSEGFSKQLDLVGVGYTIEQSNKNVLLNVGYSHPIYFTAPDGVNLEVQNRNTTVIISGIDRQKVGQVAAKLRSFRPPEPYKGKGIKYSDETVHRKAGKTVGAK